MASIWNRRTFLGSLGALAAWATSGRRLLAWPTAQSPKISGFGESGNVYDELGVTTVINGQGTMTTLGGSLMRPEVEAVMTLAGRHFASYCRSRSRRRKTHRRNAQTCLKATPRWSLPALPAAMQSGLAGILTGDNEAVHPSIARSHGDEVRGHHSEIASQPIRSPAPRHRRASSSKLKRARTWPKRGSILAPR